MWAASSSLINVAARETNSGKLPDKGLKFNHPNTTNKPANEQPKLNRAFMIFSKKKVEELNSEAKRFYFKNISSTKCYLY